MLTWRGMAALAALALALAPLAAGDAASERAALKAQFTEKRDALKGSREPGPFVELGGWCREQALADEARWCFVKAWELQPGSEPAATGLKALGYDHDGKAWRPAKEVFDKRRRLVAQGEAVQQAKNLPLDLNLRYELAMYARGFGLDKEATKELTQIIKLRPHHAAARTALGYTWLYGAWLDAEGVEQERRIDAIWKAGLEAKTAPEALLAELKAAGFTGKLADVKAVLPFVDAPRGTHIDVKLSGADKDSYAAGEYCFGVPEGYLPWRKTPLIVFLHGGGPGVGDGDQYFPQIWPSSGPRGYLTICPSVLEKKALAWNNAQHEAYVRAIVAEFKTRYHVDVERTYLMGHSMGGFGCFYLGTRMTDLFAAISPWSGGAPGAVLSALKTTPCYIIHCAQDTRVPPTSSRQAANTLAANTFVSSHVYVELDAVKDEVPVAPEFHGVPKVEQDKAVDWLAQWSLSPAARK